MRFTVRARRGGLAVCVALLALALYAGTVSAGMPMGTYNLPGPGVFPLALAAMLGAGAVVRISWLLVLRDEEEEEGAGGAGGVGGVPD